MGGGGGDILVGKKDPSQVGSTKEGLKSKAATVAISDKDAKENTGRWTCEEHVLFLKGLEMHGKGWKKIAKLIKTRTVVQIRTHAQKYFQKLSKAKKNGHGDFFLEGGRFGKKCKITGKRRGLLYGSYLVGMDGSAAISSALQPFIPTDTELGDDGVEKGVYHFLCPKVVDAETTALDDSDPEILVPVVKDEEQSVKSDGGETPAEPLPILSKITPEMYDKCAVPDWYRRGGDIEELLSEANSIDWLADNGGNTRLDISKAREASNSQQTPASPTKTSPSRAATTSGGGVGGVSNSSGSSGKNGNTSSRKAGGTTKRKASAAAKASAAKAAKAAAASTPSSSSVPKEEAQQPSVMDMDVLKQEDEDEHGLALLDEMEADLPSVFPHHTGGTYDSYLETSGPDSHGMLLLDEDFDDVGGIEF